VNITPELQSDLLNYAAFVGGQMLFLLKRASSAIRNPGTNITTRGKFFSLNGTTILIRAAFEFPFFYGYRHYGLATLAGWMGWVPPSWLQVPSSPMVAFFLGYAADSLLDWLSMSTKIPAFLRSWISENVPKIDSAIVMQKNLDVAGAANQQAAESIDVAAAAIAKAKEQAPGAPHQEINHE
jgi:hypothetical protein